MALFRNVLILFFLLQKRDYRVVKEEIINAVMTYLKKYFSLSNLPGFDYICVNLVYELFPQVSKTCGKLPSK